MFVLPIIAGTFTLMSVFLSLPLLSLLSFQSIPTIDWCSFPPIAAYIGDLIDLGIGMGVSPSVTCCAVTSAGLGVIALLVCLSYYTTVVGVGRVGKGDVLVSFSLCSLLVFIGVGVDCDFESRGLLVLLLRLGY